ncbi:MAG: hypothetical protein MJ211_09740 [Bacteroidales bacterium]|nr:hypothetical protein [Bacteroidales bacterium]
MTNYILGMNNMIYCRVTGGYAWRDDTDENITPYVMNETEANWALKHWTKACPEDHVYIKKV